MSATNPSCVWLPKVMSLNAISILPKGSMYVAGGCSVGRQSFRWHGMNGSPKPTAGHWAFRASINIEPLIRQRRERKKCEHCVDTLKPCTLKHHPVPPCNKAAISISQLTAQQSSHSTLPHHHTCERTPQCSDPSSPASVHLSQCSHAHRIHLHNLRTNHRAVIPFLSHYRSSGPEKK